MGEENGRTISTSVPLCPKCNGALRKIHCGLDTIYKCVDCNVAFIVVKQGQADNELICEELIYGEKT